MSRMIGTVSRGVRAPIIRQGDNLVDIVSDSILETAKEFNVKVLDLYNDLGIDPHDPVHFETYTTDGLHFNDAGHAVLANKVKEFIEAL